MTAYQFSQSWLSELQGQNAMSAREFAHLRTYLQGIDNGTISLFNPTLLNATINALTVGGNIAMGGFKLTGLGAGTTNGDSLRYEQLIGLYLLLTGGTMSGAIAMGGNKVTGLGAATANGDALRYEQLVGAYLLLAGGTMAGNIAMGGNKVTGLAAASANGEALRFEQLSVLQSSLTTTTGSTATSSATYQATGLTKSFTPLSASSKICIFASGELNIPATATASTSMMTIANAGTNVAATNGLQQFKNVDATNNSRLPVGFVWQEASASTSARTYDVRLANDNSVTVTFNDLGGTAVMLIVEISA